MAVPILPIPAEQKEIWDGNGWKDSWRAEVLSIDAKVTWDPFMVFSGDILGHNMRIVKRLH